MSDKSRRKILKSIAAGSGAIVAGKSLPENWAKPVVDSVLLPAHAQTSQAPVSPLSCFSTGAPFATNTPPGPDVDTSGGQVLLPWAVSVTPPPVAPDDTFYIEIWVDGSLQSTGAPRTLAADGTDSDTGSAPPGFVGAAEFRYIWGTEQCSLFWNFVNGIPPSAPGSRGPGTLSSS